MSDEKLFCVLVGTFMSLGSVAVATESRHLVCSRLFAIDGDTISCDGVKMRDMEDGAPTVVDGYEPTSALLWIPIIARTVSEKRRDASPK